MKEGRSQMEPRSAAYGVLLVLAAVQGAFAPAVLAQTSPSGGAALGLADAVLLARDNSLAAQLQRERLASTEAQRRVTVAGALPTLSVQSSANYNELPASSPLASLFGGGAGGSGGGLVGFPAQGATLDTTISANQVLFDAFATRDTIQIADLQGTIGGLAVEQAEQEAMLNAAVAYFQVLRTEGLADVAQRAVVQAGNHLRLGQVRLKAGTGTRAEVLQLRAQVAQAQGGLIQAKNGVNVARLALANAVNAPVGQRPLQADPRVPAVDVDLERDLAQALARRQEVKQANLKREIDETRVSLESRALWPTLAATTRYSQRGLNEGQFLAGVNFNWNAFDSFRTRNRMEAAQQEAQADRVQIEQARQGIALEVRQQAQNREDAQARIATAREGLAAAQEAYRIAVTRFEAGLSTYVELTDAQTTLTQARNTFVQAANDFHVAQIRLARALGLDLASYLAGR